MQRVCVYIYLLVGCAVIFENRLAIRIDTAAVGVYMLYEPCALVDTCRHPAAAALDRLVNLLFFFFRLRKEYFELRELTTYVYV